MKILITGADGQLGLACQAEFAHEDLVLVTIDIADLTRPRECKAIIASAKPDVIIHAAAYTNVRGAEADPATCYQVNAIGTAALAESARKRNIRFVYISTDYVFDGTSKKPYIETDPVLPRNVYGASKFAGELIVRDIVPRHYILRTAWLYGEGKNFIRTILAAAQTQTELKVVGDQIGSPTYAKDLASYINAVLKSDDYGIYHATNSGEASWADLAKEALRLAGKKIPVTSITTPAARELFNDPVDRPANTVLNTSKLAKITSIRSWQDALADYLGK